MAVNEDLQLPYTMDIHQLRNPYQAAVLRTDVNRAIPAYIPEILEESQLAMNRYIPVLDGKCAEVPVFDTMTHLIARISNRVIFGRKMCRNEGFLHAVVRFAETTPLMAPFIHWSPLALRPVVYFILSRILGGKKEALKYVIPFLETYMKERDYMDEKPMLVCEFLIKNAPPEETIKGLAIRLLNLNFGSIHTSSIFISQALFEIALLPKEAIDGIRAEILDALETEGGWTKSALLKFRKIDSALREVGRVYGLMYFALSRFALKGCDLGDGTSIPPGHRIAIDMKAIHYNPDIYSDPEQCDLFRFSKLREQEGSDARYGFATIDSHYLPFGAGRHACAGRFFAAMELKIMLAHILLTYDVSYSPSIKERPKNIIFNGAIVPDPKVKMVFTPREV
ncbi:cytochrome P450 [Cyathus striatus]|nr:cytochrome P450 [Cyathus striatus]